MLNRKSNPDRSGENRKLTVLVTAGPTIEDLDPVRFISNRATGKLGVEIARAALEAGCRVILIHGPLQDKVRRAIPSSKHLACVPVRSAAEMRAAVLRHLAAAQMVVMNAAVADYTPARKSRTKLKKSRQALLLRLKPTVDILAELGELKRRRRKDLVLIGFALETGTGATAQQRRKSRLAEARRKLEAKNLDAIVLDTPAAMGAEKSEFTVVIRNGAGRLFSNTSKARFARFVAKLGRSIWAVKGLLGCCAELDPLMIKLARSIRAVWHRHKNETERRKVMQAADELERFSRDSLRVSRASPKRRLRLWRSWERRWKSLERKQISS
ncbi:MAG: phosphopantothenoylcysteine decarboxylase [Planctomycetota bacterium]